jgi:hypothetical protein
MNDTTQNVPAIQKAINALAGFKNKGMTFARREDLENVSQQYQPLVTIVEFQAKDFERLGSDKAYYPRKGATNRIGDAAGVSFLGGVGGTREEGNATAIKVVEHKNGNKPSYFQIEGHYRIIGTAQGERLKPDGTPRKSSVCEYGFDVVQRTNEAILNDLAEENPRLTTEIACRKKFLELQKFGVQKARTGAELGVIRELVGMDTGFNKTDVANGCQMLFSQVIENNTFKVQVLAEIMKTQDGRAAVVQALFGATRAVFGPAAAANQLLPTETPVERVEALAVPSPSAVAPAQVDTFDDDIPAAKAASTSSDKSPLEKAREHLKSYEERLKALPPGAMKLFKTMMENKDATEEEISLLADRFENALQQKKEGAA